MSSVICVAGGGRGIGRATAVRFARDKAKVAVAARTRDDLEHTRRLVESAGGACECHVADLGDETAAAAVVQAVAERYGRLDILVNCAGLAPGATIETLDRDTFDAIARANIKSVYGTCRAAWPVMKAQGEGVMINVSSMASLDPFPGLTAYGAAKAWVNAWTRGLANEGRAVGIRVFGVAPGAVETRMLRELFPDFPEDQTLAPEDVADVIYTLAQPACRYATGETVFVRKS